MIQAVPVTGKRVLVVDDNENTALLLREEFEDDGYEVQVVRGGEEALSIVASDPPDVVVLDINMPGKDGIETLNDIVNTRGGVPVIVHTAYAAYKENYMTWAAVDYVVKSADLVELKNAVERAIGAGDPHRPVTAT